MQYVTSVERLGEECNQTNANTEQLEFWTDQVLTATSLDDIFTSDPNK